MYRPDPVILRKIQEFDRHLFVLWNNEKKYFEVWRRGVFGRKLVTPVVRSLYEPGAPREYVPLDDRILGCLFEPWGNGNHLHWYDRQEQRELAQYLEKQAQMRYNARAIGMDTYRACTNFYATKHASKNSGRPNFNKASPYGQWVRPDIQLRTSSRLFNRSATNARLYGYRGK